MERRQRVLVVEDEPATRELLAEYLEFDYDIITAQDGYGCMRTVGTQHVDLILLDVMLPDESGFNLCRKLKASTLDFIPVLMVTALNTTQDRVAGLEAGADDFLSKPFIKEELMARVRSHLRTKAVVDEVQRLRAEAAEFSQRLALEVERATSSLELAMDDLRKVNEELDASRREVIERLGCVAEHRDPETGGHARRVSVLVYLLAKELGLPEETCDMYRLAAPLHDIGKLAIPDELLLKPSNLDEREALAMRAHTSVGAKILANPGTPLVEIAYFMASGHHERLDGKGYPNGVTGDKIPLAARVCAVADAFDAMTTDRVYRAVPMTEEQAVAELVAGKGTRFDPAVVDAFLAALPKIREVRDSGKMSGEELCRC